MDGGGAANFNYWAEVLTGSGRGGSVGDDDNLMYMLRLQWNPNGKELGFSGSDLKFHEKFIIFGSDSRGDQHFELSQDSQQVEEGNYMDMKMELTGNTK